MKTRIKIAIIIMMGMSLGVNAQNTFPTDGNVGIGTTSPTNKLELRGGDFYTNGKIKWGAAELNYEYPNNQIRWGDGTHWYLSFNRKSDNEKLFSMRSSDGLAFFKGNVGIGTTTPQSKLHVVGNENGGVIVNHNYKYGYPNYGIKIIGDENTTKSGEVTLSVYAGGAYSGFDLAHGATYYGSGAYKTGANVNSSSRIIGYGGSLRFYTNANLAENTNFSPTQRMVINSSGNVGIGTITPSKRMHIKGSTGSYDQLLLEGGVSAAIQLESKDNIGDRPVISANNGNFSIQIWKDRSSWKSTPFYINQSGSIGIGTKDTRGFKLGVNGKVAATEVKVATYANWSDFVFYDDYQLPTLTEVENHIKEKGHLKDIPSAKEVEKNGFFLGAMDAKLLQKIEELTLYTIAQEKKIKLLEKQQTKLEEQEKKIEKLETLVEKLLKEKN